MTDDEKRVLKELGKMISELTYRVGLYEAVGKRYVRNWDEELAIAIASPAFQSLRQKIDDMQQSIEQLIDENNLSALLSKLPKGGLVN